jgi:hypothetical protein
LRRREEEEEEDADHMLKGREGEVGIHNLSDCILPH